MDSILLPGEHMKTGDRVWLKLSYVDGDCEVAGTFIKENKKTLRCANTTRGTVGNYAPHNVRIRDIVLGEEKIDGLLEHSFLLGASD